MPSDLITLTRRTPERESARWPGRNFGVFTTITYDALDRRAHVLLGNSVAVSYLFDSAGRETARTFITPTGAWLAGFTATYDNVGNRLSQNESQYVSGSLQSRVTSYAYDTGDQLVSEICTGANAYSFLYSYDPLGNRLSKIHNGIPTTYTYGGMNQIATQQQYPNTLTNFVYDLDGNLLVSNEGTGLATYTWDGMGFLATANSNGVLSTYSHDIDAMRRRRDTTGSDSTMYLWDATTCSRSTTTRPAR